jgi:DNA gyrase/topoisomerase IV subunit A
LEKEGKPLTEKEKAEKAKISSENMEIQIDSEGNEISTSDTYVVSIDEIMEIIKGPDFPT